MTIKGFKKLSLTDALGLGKAAKEKAPQLPVGDMFSQPINSVLGFLNDLERPTGIVGGMDGPSM